MRGGEKADAKGEGLSVARRAGILGAKRTSDRIPLCHPLSLTGGRVELELEDNAFVAWCEVKITERTGVEMEALTGVSIAQLTIYDMCKSVDKSMEISGIRLLKKTGGNSRVYVRP